MTLPHVSPASPATNEPAPAPAPVAPSEIDASCRWPVLFLLVCAGCWLAIAAGMELLASIKMHAPNLFAARGWLSYGRLIAASQSALVYGFATQAGLAAGIWMLCRLGRNRLEFPWFIAVAAFFWNCGVKIGLLGILIGEGTGYPMMEIPGYAAPILFVSFVMMGVWALYTFHQRTERSLYVSQWYIVAGLLWFPWIYSTATVLLIYAPVRGILQSVVHFWYANNLVTLWLTPMALAVAYYFIPRMTGRPLHSRYIALFGFWMLAVFGGWAGVPLGTPLPAWVGSVSAAAGSMLLIPILAVAVNLHFTLRGAYKSLDEHPALNFIAFGLLAYLAGGIASAAMTFEPVARLVQFTYVVPAVNHLMLQGFAAMTFIGAFYYIVPRMMGTEWPFPKLIKAHFGLAAIGSLFYAVILVMGGLRQGARLQNGEIPFSEISAQTLPFIRAATIGQLLTLGGAVLLLVNLVQAFRVGCPICREMKKFTEGRANPELVGKVGQ